jgi:hypothetical protein
MQHYQEWEWHDFFVVSSWRAAAACCSSCSCEHVRCAVAVGVTRACLRPGADCEVVKLHAQAGDGVVFGVKVGA